MHIRWLFLLSLLVWTGCESNGKSFTGSYSGDGVALEITGAGPEHQGNLRVGGKTYPVEATSSGDQLKGLFQSGDESFELVAKFSGDTLELKSGGKTHRLTKAGGKNPLAENSGKQAANPLATASGAQDEAPGEAMNKGATGFGGNYSGNIEGTGTSLQLASEGDVLTGVMDSGGYKYNLKGKITGPRAEGTLTDPQAGGAQMSFEAKLDGDNVVISMKVPGAAGLDIPFQRGTSAASKTTASKGSAGEERVARDPSLVGTWSKTTSMSSGDMGFASKEYLRITADGRFQLGAGEAIAGGGAGSIRSGDGVEITAQGKWKTQGRQVLINEGSGWQPFARYYIEGNKLMFTLGDGSRQIWYR